MKTITTIISVCAILMMGLSAVAQQQAPPGSNAPEQMAPNTQPGPAPHVPGAPSAGFRSRSVIVGPTDSKGVARHIRGEVTVTAVPPNDVAVKSVAIYFDDTLIGQLIQGPFQVQYKTDAAADGSHQFKAIGMGENANEVWSAITKVEVRNSSKSAALPVLPTPSVNRNRNPEVKPAAVMPNIDTKLAKTYSNSRCGFSVQYPAGWTTKDQTKAMKPNQPGNVWVELSPSASQKSGLVVNVRRMRLEPKTDADVFAKFNPYVSKWDRRTELDSQAFATTTDDAASKKIIHRLIVIKNGYAWMLNCIDTSGKPSDESKAIFDSIVGSLKISSGNGVTITEIKKKR